MLRAIRHGVPTIDSIGDALQQIFERLGHLLYSGSREAESSPLELVTDERLKLQPSLEAWRERLSSLRADLHAACPAAAERFIDPVDYFDAVLASADRERTPSWAGGKLGLLRGAAHGDLHGRNVLVGEVREQVLWPTVFDYEHMGRQNLVAWDFVKMETVLKIRAYNLLYSETEPRFIHRVRDLEEELGRRTELCYHQEQTWQAVIDDLLADDGPTGRLAAVVMTIRQLASAHLGRNHNWMHRWLEEYYMLLSVYSVHAGRFTNLLRRESMALLISGGVALSRTRYFRQETFDEGDEESTESSRDPSYHGPLERIRQAIRSAQRDEDRREALAAAEELWARFPHAIPVAEELVHARFVLGDLEEGRRVLESAARRLRSPSEELYCRWGKLEKTLGLIALDDGSTELQRRAAAIHFKQAEAWYLKGYGIRQGHYPGVNVAALHLLQADLCGQLGDHAAREQRIAAAQEIASSLLKSAANWPIDREEDRLVWHPATRGEAALIAGNPDDAMTWYRESLDLDGLSDVDARSIRDQLTWLVGVLRRLGLPCPTEPTLRLAGLDGEAASPDIARGAL